MTIIDENIDQKLFYSLFNQSNQIENYILINSIKPIKDFNFELPDLKSRLQSFVNIGIDLPTDDLLTGNNYKIISEKQINIDPKVSKFIIKNVDRSYDKMFKFLKKLMNYHYQLENQSILIY